MATFASGQRLTAADLNDILLTAILPSNISRTSSTAFVDAAGLSVPLLANSTYAIDGWLFYSAHPSGDFMCKFSVPSGADGWWSLWGPYALTAPIAGSERKNYTDYSAAPLTTQLAAAGDDEFTDLLPSCMPRGYVTTAGTAGNLQLQFTQLASHATSTILRAGSWLRISRLV